MFSSWIWPGSTLHTAVTPTDRAPPMRTIERRPWTLLRRRRSTRKWSPPGSIELCNVTYTEGDAKVLLDAGLVLSAGSTTCVVGSNERDQAALAGLLLGLSVPESGTIELDGHDIASLDLDLRSELVAGVLQEPWMLDGSIADNVAFHRRGLGRDRVEMLCQAVGADRFIEVLPAGYDAPVHGLTLGQRRQIALARALASDPRVLVLEEPTTDLDPDEEREVLRAVSAAAEGRTTIVLTHRLSLARRADSVLVIDDGRVIPYRAGGPTGGHAALWDTRVPPVINADDGRPHLRLVGSSRGRPAQPSRGWWDIEIGTELVPGHLASGLLARTANTETWVAWSIGREEPVRVKVPRVTPAASVDHPDDPVTYRSWEQLAREHRVLANLDHPGVTRSLQVDLEAQMPHLVVEYLDSTSLARVLQREAGGLDPLDVLHIGFELVGTLHHLHQRGWVHLNLRAGHVRTRGDVVVITDLTQCRPIGATIPEPVRTDRNRNLERPFFAPEFRPGHTADPKMDIYALGTLMHRATAGTVHASTQAGRDRPLPYDQLGEGIPAPMARTVDRMLDPDPEARPTAWEVLSQFRLILPRSLTRPRVSTVRTRSNRLRLVSPNN